LTFNDLAEFILEVNKLINYSKFYYI